MLPTWLYALGYVSASHAPEFVAGLVICGVALLVVSDHRLALVAFLAQRLIVIVLLWPSIRTAFEVTSIITFLAVAVISCGSEWLLQHTRTSGETDVRRGSPFRMSAPFRVLTASLGALVTYGLVQMPALHGLPHSVALTVIWLILLSLLILLLSDSGLGTGLGVLTFADGSRIIYALCQPNLLVWGLWSVCDVLVTLAASHLRHGEIAAAGGRAAGGCQ